MNKLYRIIDIEEVVVEMECIEDLLVKVDTLVEVGKLDEAMECLVDVQKSVRALQALQNKRKTQRRNLEIIAKVLIANGIRAKVVDIHV